MILETQKEFPMVLWICPSAKLTQSYIAAYEVLVPHNRVCRPIPSNFASVKTIALDFCLTARDYYPVDFTHVHPPKKGGVQK